MRLTHHNLDHHAAVRAGKTGCASGINQLRDERTAKRRKELVFQRREMTYETKNIDTPMGPRSIKTPVTGKIIIPSRNHVLQANGKSYKLYDVQDMPSSILTSSPRMTAGSASAASVAVDLARATHL